MLEDEDESNFVNQVCELFRIIDFNQDKLVEWKEIAKHIIDVAKAPKVD